MGTGTVLAAGGLWSMLEEVNWTVVEEMMAPVQSLAVILAAMLAALSLVRTSPDYVRGESRMGWQILRPMVILMAVMLFPTLCRAFDGIVGIFTREMADISDADLRKLADVVADSFEAIPSTTEQMAAEADALAQEENWGLWKKIREGLKIAASSYFRTRSVSLLTVLAFLGRLIIEATFMLFEVLAAVFLAILRIGGPFICALSIPEEWRSGLSGWVARYIQISLWMPVGFLIIGLLTAYYRAICEAVIDGSHGSGFLLVGMVLIVAAVTCIFAIPKVAAWFIRSSGSGNAQSGMERSLQSLGRKAVGK